MSAQTTLTEDVPMILDATCSYPHSGGRTQRFPTHATLRMDKRREVGPDIVADACFMPFRPHVFTKVVCDPPHLIRTSEVNFESLKKAQRRHPKYGRMSMFQRYGWWRSREEWLDFARRTNEEFYRILRPDGIVAYKISDAPRSTRLSELRDASTNFTIEPTKPPTKSHVHHETASMVHWLTMRPKP